jgi:hypothetical protein
MVETLESPNYAKMSGQEFLAACKEKGVKPCCRGRTKATVIAELEAAPVSTAVEKETPARGFFTWRQHTKDAAEIRTKKGGLVAVFRRKGNVLNHSHPQEQPFAEYAEACCALLNEKFGHG